MSDLTAFGSHDPICPAPHASDVCMCPWIKNARADERKRIRAKVEALPSVPSTYDGTPIKVDPATIQGVIALIDGSGKPDHPEPTPSGKGSR